MSLRTKVVALSLALFAPTALIILTGARPSTVHEYISTWGHGPWAQLGHRALVFSLVGDGLAWLTCLALCFLIGRLAYRLRDRLPFGLTLSILALFIVCFGLQRLMGYAFWTPLARIGPELEIIRAVALVVVAMGSAVLYPYVRAMFDAIISAHQDHEKFLVAAEQPGCVLHPGERSRPCEQDCGLSLLLCECQRRAEVWQAADGTGGEPIERSAAVYGVHRFAGAV